MCVVSRVLCKGPERGIEHIVGVDPKLAEDMVEVALQKNYISTLKDERISKREKFLNSRFDYCGVDANNVPFIMEVKNVPLADYVDCLAKEKKDWTFVIETCVAKSHTFPMAIGKSKQIRESTCIKHITELTDMRWT